MPAPKVPLGDIVSIVMGVALLLLGALIPTIYTGVSTLVVNQFSNMTNTSITDYTQVVSSFIPPVLQMSGLVLIIASVAHIIYILITVVMGSTKEAASAAT